jgi:Zn-dependent protease
MQSSWKLGTAFGIGIYVHWTFVLLPALVLFEGWSAGGALFALTQFVLMLAVCGCIVLHELGHALMARYFHIATRDITLYPIGGVARLEKMTTRPSEEVWIALAGPAVNFVIAGLLAMVFVPMFGSPLALGRIYDASVQGFLQGLLLSNIFLALFNLLPAFPMDGGRVLRAIMAMFIDYVSATQIACYMGMAMAGLFVVASMVLWQLGGAPPTLALIGVFVIFAGLQELAMVRQREARRNAEPIDVLPAGDEPYVVHGPVDSKFSGYTWDSRAQAFIRWRQGRPVAMYSAPSE